MGKSYLGKFIPILSLFTSTNLTEYQNHGYKTRDYKCRNKNELTFFQENQRWTRDIMKSCGLIRNIFSTHIRSDCSFEWIRILMLISFGCINISIKWLITNHPRYCGFRFCTQCDTSRYFFICGTCKIFWKIFITTFRWTA